MLKKSLKQNKKLYQTDSQTEKKKEKKPTHHILVRVIAKTENFVVGAGQLGEFQQRILNNKRKQVGIIF
jgi:hypothetical protein